MTPSDSLVLLPQRPDLLQVLLELPETFGVYAIRNEEAVLHLSRTTNLRRRLMRLLHPQRGPGARLAEQMAQQSAFIECWPTGSALETSLHLYGLALKYFPDDYLRRLRLRLPWFVSVTQDDYPRLAVSNRAPGVNGMAVGPFPNRDTAARYEESALQLFQVRRCTETLRPTPEHPGCVYGEMNLCLRPCQEHVTKQEYATEAGRLTHFLSAGVNGAIASLTMAREKAAAELDFEWASQLHRNIERMTAAKDARPDVVAVINDFNGIALEPGLAAGTCTLRVMWGSRWRDPVRFASIDGQDRSVSLDRRLREALDGYGERSAWPGEPAEHLALFSRWFHAHSRTGEWFPFSAREGLPYRKLARGISRLTAAQLDLQTN